MIITTPTTTKIIKAEIPVAGQIMDLAVFFRNGFDVIFE
jgi:hypothetical protein